MSTKPRNANSRTRFGRSILAPGCAFVAALAIFPARGDFVDELPALPLTPAPLPTTTPAGKAPRDGVAPDQGLGNSTSRPGAAGEQGSGAGAQGQGSPAASGKGNRGGRSGSAGKTSPGNVGGKEKSSGVPGAGGPVSQASPAPGSAVVPGEAASDGGLFGSDVVQHNTQAPISTQGDVLEGSLNKGRVFLNGNVEIRQDDTLMKSDVAEIFSKPGTTSPERAVARGNVSIFKRPNPRVPEIRAVAEELEYFVNERRVILKGKPKIWRGKELVQGEVIELALDTGDIRIRSARSVVDPRNQQDLKAREGTKGRP
jgi:lipopolysaccharide transport protein LptA